MIQTKRLNIRLFQERDLEEVYEIYQDVEVCRYLLHEPWNVSNKKELFQIKMNNRSLESKLSLAVCLENRVIGDISLWNTDMKDTVEIGYAFHPQYTGYGYAQEALQAIVQYLFEQWDVHRIQANMDARNIASARVCERIGMRKEAHFIQDFWNKEEWTDSFVYGMLKQDL